MIGENGTPETPDWHVPSTSFCRRLLGDDLCDCTSCQVDAHTIPANVELAEN